MLTLSMHITSIKLYNNIFREILQVESGKDIWCTYNIILCPMKIESIVFARLSTKVKG